MYRLIHKKLQVKYLVEVLHYKYFFYKMVYKYLVLRRVKKRNSTNNENLLRSFYEKVSKKPLFFVNNNLAVVLQNAPLIFYKELVIEFFLIFN